MKASIYTLGCRVNQYESDAIAEQLRLHGFETVPFGEECDVAIINTCTVTAESDRKSRQFIRRAKNVSPHCAVIVTGCFAQSSPEAASVLADAVVGNGEKSKIADIAKMLCRQREKVFDVTDISRAVYDETPISKPKRARTFIKIEDGCENKCAYCIIPKARGAVRSRPADEVIREAERIARAGCREIILTGIETASYGKDLKTFGLSELIKKVSEVDGVERIALGSLDPSCMTEDFVSAVSQVRELLPHFHLSVQSGCTRTLNRMRRKYTAEKVLENMERVRKYIPDVTFSADVIAGFPGETDGDFAESVEFFKRAEFLHLHIFPYSVREGTEAAEMPQQIPENVKKERAAYLAAVQKEIQDKFLDGYIEKHREEPVYVLCEKWENGVCNGHTEHFAECDIPSECDLTGKILPVTLTGRCGAVVKGEFL